jgi:hypothetical protein
MKAASNGDNPDHVIIKYLKLTYSQDASEKENMMKNQKKKIDRIIKNNDDIFSRRKKKFTSKDEIIKELQKEQFAFSNLFDRLRLHIIHGTERAISDVRRILPVNDFLN